MFFVGERALEARTTSVVAALVVLGLGGCGSPAPAPSSPASPKTREARAVPPAPTEPPEQTLTPARWRVVSDVPELVRSEVTSLSQPFRLGPGRLGFLGDGAARNLATDEGVRTIDEPQGIVTLCVAADLKTTFAAVRQGTSLRLMRAASFEGPMTPVGDLLWDPFNRLDARWVARTAAETILVDCASGATERMFGPADRAEFIAHTERVDVFSFGVGKHNVCLWRALPDRRWNEAPGCRAYARVDHSVELSAELPPDWQKRKLKPRCLFVLTPDGKRAPCNTPVGPAFLVPRDAPLPEQPIAERGRFFARGRVAAPGSAGHLLRVDGPGLQGVTPFETRDLLLCEAVLPNSALFLCSAENKFDVMVRVLPDGTLHEELRRPKISDRGGRIAFTAGGGVAIAGTCAGELAQAACVRDVRGGWRTVTFSPEVNAALTRTAPGTQLIPRDDGTLFIGTGTAQNDALTDVRIQLFQADRGAAVAVERLPAWILMSLGGVGDYLTYAFRTHPADQSVPVFSFSRADRIRVWPLSRQDPAFGMAETCSAEVDLGGKLYTQCTPGVIRAVGRLGILRKGPRELYETLDAGVSFRPLDLPANFTPSDLDCTSIGCRSGPYVRVGWGLPASR